MGAVCKMGGEGRLGVGVERETIWGALFAKRVFRIEGGGTPTIGAVCAMCEMAGRWPPIDMGWALFAKRVRLGSAWMVCKMSGSSLGTTTRAGRQW